MGGCGEIKHFSHCFWPHAEQIANSSSLLCNVDFFFFYGLKKIAKIDRNLQTHIHLKETENLAGFSSSALVTPAAARALFIPGRAQGQRRVVVIVT